MKSSRKKVLFGLVLLVLLSFGSPSYAFWGEMVDAAKGVVEWGKGVGKSISETEFYVKALENLEKLKSMWKETEQAKKDYEEVADFFEDLTANPGQHVEKNVRRNLQYIIPGGDVLVDIAQNKGVGIDEVKYILRQDYKSPLRKVLLKKYEEFFRAKYFEEQEKDAPWGKWVVGDGNKSFVANLYAEISANTTLSAIEQEVAQKAVQNVNREALAMYRAQQRISKANVTTQGQIETTRVLEEMLVGQRDAEEIAAENLAVNKRLAQEAATKKKQRLNYRTQEVFAKTQDHYFQLLLANQKKANQQTQMKSLKKLGYWSQYIMASLTGNDDLQEDMKDRLYSSTTQTAEYKQVYLECRSFFIKEMTKTLRDEGYRMGEAEAIALVCWKKVRKEIEGSNS